MDVEDGCGESRGGVLVGMGVEVVDMLIDGES